MNIEKLYRKDLDNLWHNTSCSKYSSIGRGYAIERNVAKESILFISLNPSYSSAKAWNNGNSNSSVFYDIPPIEEKNNTNSFFAAINEFYDSLSVPKPPLAHHDLLFVRETKQESVKAMIKDPILSQFVLRQLEISKSIIYDSRPQLVVVLNAEARELIKEKCEKDFIGFDPTIGANVYKLNGQETPFLFSGMLSGQHALDKGSRESLKWHIELIIKSRHTSIGKP